MSWFQTILQANSDQKSNKRYWHENRHIDQWKRIESPEINPHLHGHLIYDQEGKNIQKGKDSLFNKWCWENWTDICKKNNKTEPPSYTMLKNKLEMNQRLKWRPKIINFLEENIGSKLCDIAFNNFFLI